MDTKGAWFVRLWGELMWCVALSATAAALAIPAANAAAAPITVTTTGDTVANDGACSLREAVSAANTNTPSGAMAGECPAGSAGPAADTISVGAGSFDLTGASEDANASGDLDVGTNGTPSGPLTIDGVALGSTSITGPTGGVDRAIDVRGSSLTVQDLSVDDSVLIGGNGAGIRAGVAGTSLTVLNSAVSTNQAGGNGAGIFAGPGVPLTISGSTISGNTASLSPNGGGGVSSAQSLTITGSTISGNTATNLSATADGGGVRATTGPVTIESTEISGNHSLAGGNGGGLSVGLLFGADSAIRHSQVLDNTAPSGLGGGIDMESTFAVEDSVVSGNTAHDGGGILHNSTGGLIARTTVTTNNAVAASSDNAPSGGGIAHFGGNLTIIDSSIVANNATGDSDDSVRGGGISVLGLPLTIIGTRISGNTTGGGTIDIGGGLHAGSGGTVAIANSTISGNAASSGGGTSTAITSGGQMTFVNVTMNGNIANVPPEAIDADADWVTTLRGSIVDNGSGACVGPITSAGYNLDRGSSCGFAPPLDLENVLGTIIDPLLDNGGPTRTQALPLGSPALDLIPVAECNDDDLLPPAGVQALTEDQRGYPRPFPAGGACDAGSYEMFACDAVIQTPPGPFVGCPPPPTGGGTPGVTQPPTTQPPTTGTRVKKCKRKKKHKHRADAAKKKKKCKRKKKRR
jgi:CSLREA domain-containing protein